MSSREAVGASRASASTSPDQPMTFTSAPPSASQEVANDGHPRLSLLGMPAEIRDKIWTMCVGGRRINIGFCDHETMTFELDRRSSPTHLLTDALDGINPSASIDMSFQLKSSDSGRRGNCITPPEKLKAWAPLNLLRSNRQISNEAVYVLYHKNIFSFIDMQRMAEFCQRLEARSRSYLKDIFLLGASGYHSTSDDPLSVFKNWPRTTSLPRDLALDTIRIERHATKHFQQTITNDYEVIVTLVEHQNWTVNKVGVNLLLIESQIQDFKPPPDFTVNPVLQKALLLLIIERFCALQLIALFTSLNRQRDQRLAQAATTIPVSANVTEDQLGPTHKLLPPHPVQSIAASRRGPGRGGPVRYLVQWADEGIVSFLSEWLPYEKIDYAVDALAQFHRENPQQPQHKKFAMPVATEEEGTSTCGNSAGSVEMEFSRATTRGEEKLGGTSRSETV